MITKRFVTLGVAVMLSIACAVQGKAAEDIVVVAGTYGGNCNQPAGNKTAFLAQACDGQSQCSYRVDRSVIGDPAYGCRKDYVANWRCGRSPEVHSAAVPPEAGDGSVVQLFCADAPPRGEDARAGFDERGDANRIGVVAGTYGGNCNQPTGNKTAFLAQACDGQSQCSYRIDRSVIGDPAYGCRKDYVANWRCGRSGEIHSAAVPPEAGDGSIVQLFCAEAPYRGEDARAGFDERGGANRIAVVAGTYGGNCNQPTGNKTAFLAQACDGQSQCSYRVDRSVIGDPAYGCRKDYVANWRCGRSGEIHSAAVPPEAGDGSVVQLFCPEAPYRGDDPRDPR